MFNNPELRERESVGETRIGGGDNIRISELTAQKEVSENNMFRDTEVQLSQEEIKEMLDAFNDLPFHIGNPAGTQSFGPDGEIPDSDRPTHEARVNLSPSVHGLPDDVPESERQYCLAFKFDKDVWGLGFRLIQLI